MGAKIVYNDFCLTNKATSASTVLKIIIIIIIIIIYIYIYNRLCHMLMLCHATSAISGL